MRREGIDYFLMELNNLKRVKADCSRIDARNYHKDIEFERAIEITEEQILLIDKECNIVSVLDTKTVKAAWVDTIHGFIQFLY